MYSKKFLLVAITCNIAFLFLYLHNKNKLIQLSYEQQKIDKQLKQAQSDEKELLNQLHSLQQHTTIQKKATRSLKMKPVALKQMRDLHKEQ